MKSFKPIFVEGTTLDDTWFRLLAEVYNHGRRNRIDTGSYEKETDRLEFDFVAGSIKYPTNRPLSPRLEGLAVPPPTTDEDIEKYFANYLMNGALTSNEHYKYATWIVGGDYRLPKAKMLIECITKGGKPATVITPVGDLCYTKKKGQGVIARVPNALDWIVKHYQEKGYANNHCYIQVGYPESNMAYDIPYSNEMERQTSPCILPTSRVLTIEGYKNAEEIKENDLVFTHKGNWKKVVKVYKRKYNGWVNEIRIRGFNQRLFLTQDHPVYGIKVDYCPYDKYAKNKLRCKPNCKKQYSCYESNNKTCKKIYNKYNRNWMDAKKISDLYYVSVPKIKNKEIICPFSNEEMYLFGIWLAEGDYDKGIRFNLGTHEEDLIDNIISLFEKAYDKKPSYTYLGNENGSCTRISFCSAELERKYRNLFGSLAREKRIPFDFLFYNKKSLEQLIKGFCDGDGYKREELRESLYTSSENLKEMFSLIIPKIGYIPTITKRYPEDKYLKNEKRWIKSNGPGYCFEWTRNEKRRFYWEDKEYFNIPISTNNLEYWSGLVYNYEVEDDNSYFANGIPIHNCLRGIDTKIVEEDDIKYLLMNVYFRSWDLWGGWPENMGGMVRLMETICEMLGDVEPGALSFASKGLHCYWFQLDAVACRLNIEREQEDEQG